MDDVDAISFGTDGWRARTTEFTRPRVRMVGQAVADHLADRVAGPVAVGYDAREGSRGFAETLADVLAANGRDVLLATRDCPTPALAWTVARECAGGLMITASHNPPGYNGVKFVPADGAPAMPEVTADIEARLADPSTGGAGTVVDRPLAAAYLDHAAAFVTTDLDGRRIAYDAMHGSGRGVTDALLSRLGATVTQLRCERDPTFGGTAPEPVPERATDLVARVTDGPAALGLINDGDADRLGVVTPERGFLDPNVLLAVLYDALLARTEGDAVRTVSTSSLVDRVAETADRTVHETAVGFKWVAEAMREHGAVVGGEESGGYGVTAHLRNKDGVLLAGLLAAADRERAIDDRVGDLLAAHGPVHQDRVSVDCPDDRKEGAVEALGDRLGAEIAGVAVAEVHTVDGFKMLLADDTWLLVRPSGTEPKLRIYAEAADRDRVAELLAAGRSLVEATV